MSPPPPLSWWRALADLVLPRACAGCDLPRTWWCADCSLELARAARLVPVTGVGRCAGVAPYRGPVGRALVAFKERGVVALREPLGAALADAVLVALPRSGSRRPVALVPVPSRPAVVRLRGGDVLAGLARVAAARLCLEGRDALAVPALAHRRRVVDQTGLDPRARHANLADALRIRPAAIPLLTGRALVVVDDVVTSGASLGEAIRVLAAAVPGSAPVAAVVGVAGSSAEVLPVRGTWRDWVVRPAGEG